MIALILLAVAFVGGAYVFYKFGPSVLSAIGKVVGIVKTVKNDVAPPPGK